MDMGDSGMGYVMETDTPCYGQECLPLFDSPQCLIDTGPDGRLVVREDILRQVGTLDKPLVVVAIAGLYRTGKSYLMNRLAGKSSGFALGSAIQAKTKGIWIWALPHPHDRSKYLVLLDTEGLGDVAKGDANHDTWVFCLATLLSSVLVYNALGAINDDVLGKLNFITEMSRHIKTKQQSGDGDKNFDWYFPDFVYAVRDFMLDLELNGRPISEDEYLEYCLQQQPSKGERFNRPRQCIRKYFKKRKCFTFDRPGGRSVLKNMENVGDSELSRDFIQDTNKFCNHIFKEGPVKKLENGQVLTGNMWAVLVKSYVESIRNGSVPCIENAVVAMATIENEKAINLSIEFYRKNMMERANLPTPDDYSLSKLHEEMLGATIKLFLSRAVFDSGNRFQGKLNNLIAAEYESLIRANHEASKDKCVALLLSLEQPVRQKMSEGHYSCPGGYSQYSADVQEIQRQYLAQDGLGVKLREVLLDFMNKKMEEGKGIMAADQQITEREKAAEAERKKALEAEHQREMAERERQLAQQQSEEREKAMMENIRQLEEKQAKEIAELTRHHQEVVEARIAEQRRLLEEGYKREADALRREIQELRNRPPPPSGGGGCNIL